jgi:hypothetical protein
MAAMEIKRSIRRGLGALLLVACLAAITATASPASALTDKNVEALVLKWFAEMQSGQIDRTQLAPEYNSELTNDAIQGMSQYLKAHEYGVPPSRAEVVQTSKSGDQAFYVVKLIFPRGDAGRLLFGFNHKGKITGIILLSMAGD